MVHRLLKRLLSGVLALTLVFSINGIAAVETDNDGSAFITKAEFDSLKNSFEAQIDSYNTQIDSKIDNAIASYLAGIVISTSVQRQKIININEWTFWCSTDYPQYEEGKPYIHGTNAVGHSKISNSEQNATWMALTINGKTEYKNNGGFKKHFINTPIKNESLNGNANFYSEYDGYYVNEGEDITLGGWTGVISSSTWATSNETYLCFVGDEQPTGGVTCPGTCYNKLRISTNANGGGGYTSINLAAQSAQRIKGIKSNPDGLGFYDTVVDNRFWDKNVENKLGIWPTTPYITNSLVGDNFKTWWTDVAGTMRDAYASFRLQDWNASTAEWRTTSYNGYNSYDIADTYVTNASYKIFPLKMMNNNDNIQFERLWMSNGDAAAVIVGKLIDDGKITGNDALNAKKGLIYDADNNVHLSFSAGFPLISVQKDEKVSWTFKVTGTKAARICGKYGPFDPSVDAETQADNLFVNEDGTTSKVAVAQPGVDTLVKINVDKDSVLFFKWQSDTTPHTAITLDVSTNPTVQLVGG